MRRLALSLAIITLSGTAWSAFEAFRIKHPVSGQELTIPGQNGPNALLVNGWKTTPAGRQLASGDMILSGQVSPDGTLFAFTNTGYTQRSWHGALVQSPHKRRSVYSVGDAVFCGTIKRFSYRHTVSGNGPLGVSESVMIVPVLVHLHFS